MPDPTRLASIAQPEQRLRAALTEQYAYYGRDESLTANALRDLPIMQERMMAAGLSQLDLPEGVRRFYSQPDRMREVLGRGWGVGDAGRPRLDAVLGLALAFPTWRTLVREHCLDVSAAVDLMVHAIMCAAVPGAFAAEDC